MHEPLRRRSQPPMRQAIASAAVECPLLGVSGRHMWLANNIISLQRVSMNSTCRGSLRAGAQRAMDHPAELRLVSHEIKNSQIEASAIAETNHTNLVTRKRPQNREITLRSASFRQLRRFAAARTTPTKNAPMQENSKTSSKHPRISTPRAR
jgi:hypothetical protein